MSTDRDWVESDRDRVESVRAEVLAFRPAGPDEERWRTEFLEALAAQPRPLDRDADPVHVTASGIVVGPRGVLLHRHRRLGLWLQPGGHLDPGETPATAARREVAEETGILADHAGPGGQPQLVHLYVGPGGRGHTHLDLRYLLVARADDPRPPEGESQDVAWFGWAEAMAIADPGLLGALQLVARLVGADLDTPR
jgi:8-oxo-dGTP pyrophosphatase MutT (NUDIX family)